MTAAGSKVSTVAFAALRQEVGNEILAFRCLSRVRRVLVVLGKEALDLFDAGAFLSHRCDLRQSFHLFQGGFYFIRHSQVVGIDEIAVKRFAVFICPEVGIACPFIVIEGKDGAFRIVPDIGAVCFSFAADWRAVVIKERSAEAGIIREQEVAALVVDGIDGEVGFLRSGTFTLSGR